MKNDYKKYAEAVVNAILEYKNIAVPGTSDYYIVKSGDSLWSIAKKYGVTVNELKNANNLTTNTLSIGQRLKIPVKSSTDTDQKNYINYTVKSGDSLYSIAQKNNLTVQELKSYNNLTSDVLQIGQTIRIPIVANEQLPTDNYIDYIVKSGDSLYSIGKKYGFTFQELIDYNNLDNTVLSIGQVIKIPKSSSNLEQVNYITYTVKPNDSLYSIGTQYDVSAQQLKDYNNLSSNLLDIGQTLKIPISATNSQNNYIEYNVKSGDNLYTIGRRYGYTAQELMNYNNLKSNLLSIGQTIKIPLSK
ncbi:MAG: LysM peptidoglycan-binding domain-containing protein [Bacilli bacterium]|nr:LysM peptidoglycan-binding domain-containing protein [Bacilli bacterium]